jgi:hypothetical protein
VEGIAVGKFQRGTYGNLGLDERGEQTMFVENGLATPAAGSIEFRDDVLPVVEPHIIDPVLEGIQRETMAGWNEAGRLDRLKHTCRRQTKEELGFFLG